MTTEAFIWMVAVQGTVILVTGILFYKVMLKGKQKDAKND